MKKGSVLCTMFSYQQVADGTVASHVTLKGGSLMGKEVGRGKGNLRPESLRLFCIA